MANNKITKRAILTSALALFVCFAMLVGATFAWFTDSVTSDGNIIQTGTLEIEVSWANGKENPASATWTNANEGAIFNYDNWEPGYADVKHVKIENKGTLGLKYIVKIVANGEVTDLADVIDVYYFDPAAQITDRAALTADKRLGTLTEVLAGVETSATGELAKGENHTITLALKMQETAGNEYKGKSIGTDFSVVVFATQLAAEEDAFGPEYDENAPYVDVATAAELQAVLNEGGYARLTADIAATNNKRFDIPAGVSATIDLNGYTITSKDGGGANTMAIFVDKGAELTLNDSKGTGKIVSSCYGIYVKQNAKLVMNGGTLSVSGNGKYDYGVVVWNSSFIMNGGTIDSQFGVWASNYYRDIAGETGLNRCSVIIADGCVLNSTGYADVEYYDAPDAFVKVPAGTTLYPQ